MKAFQVPQQEIQVRVTLRAGGEVDGGFFFFAACGPGGAPGRLVDRLNDPAETFLPLSDGAGGKLLHKDQILTVRVRGDSAGIEPPDSKGDIRTRVRLTLSDGTAVEGQLTFTMPPGRGRVLDFLNAAPRFIALSDEASLTWIHRDAIVSVENSNEPAPLSAGEV